VRVSAAGVYSAERSLKQLFCGHNRTVGPVTDAVELLGARRRRVVISYSLDGARSVSIISDDSASRLLAPRGEHEPQSLQHRVTRLDGY